MQKILYFCAILIGLTIKPSTAGEFLLQFVNSIRAERSFIKMAYDDGLASLAYEQLYSPKPAVKKPETEQYLPLHIVNIINSDCIQHEDMSYKEITYSAIFLNRLVGEFCKKLLHRNYGRVGLATKGKEMVIIVSSLAKIALTYWNKIVPNYQVQITEEESLPHLNSLFDKNYIHGIQLKLDDETVTNTQIERCVRDFRNEGIHNTFMHGGFSMKIEIFFSPAKSVVSFHFLVSLRKDYYESALCYLNKLRKLEDSPYNPLVHLNDTDFEKFALGNSEHNLWKEQQDLSKRGGDMLMVLIDKLVEYTTSQNADVALEVAMINIFGRNQLMRDFLVHEDTKYVQIEIEKPKLVNGKLMWTAKLRLYKFYAVERLSANALQAKEGKLPQVVKETNIAETKKRK